MYLTFQNCFYKAQGPTGRPCTGGMKEGYLLGPDRFDLTELTSPASLYRRRSHSLRDLGLAPPWASKSQQRREGPIG